MSTKRRELYVAVKTMFWAREKQERNKRQETDRQTDRQRQRHRDRDPETGHSYYALGTLIYARKVFKLKYQIFFGGASIAIATIIIKLITDSV